MASTAGTAGTNSRARQFSIRSYLDRWAARGDAPPRVTSTLNAVHDDDLGVFLKNLGVATAFHAGKLKCAFCGDVITFENLYAVFADSGSVKFACDRADCAKALASKVANRVA